MISTSPVLWLCRAVLFCGAFALPLSAKAATPPNILFILTDDQGWATLSCQGNKLVPTPHLDKLARDGMRFTDAYVMPQCTPTRAALLSGQHTARTGMWHVLPWYGTPWARMTEPAFREQFPRETFNLPKGLRSAGYATGMAGKWHLTTGADGDYVALKPEAGAAYGFDFVAPRGPGSQNEGDKQVDYLTGQAMQFIEQHRAQPWFFYLAHHTIHSKVSAPEALVAKHLAQGAPAVGMGNATYRAAIEHMDNSVGRLLAKLDELKLRDSTLVIFLSDNGGVKQMYDAKDFKGEGTGRLTKLRVSEEQFDNAPLRDGKGGAYEGGLRVPCIVRWPGQIHAGTVEHTPVHVVDWMPTLFAAAGTNAPANHTTDGVNLLPLLRGGSLAPRALYWHMPLYDLRWAATPCAVIREGDWKLIESFGDYFDEDATYQSKPRLQLFNLKDDLGEQHDLVGTDPARAAKLSGQLRAWLKSIPAEVPSANPHHDATRELQETSNKVALRADDFPKDGLVLWLNAAQVELQDGSIKQLTDLSGKGNHAKRQPDAKQELANPIVAKDAAQGPPVLRFDGRHCWFAFNEITDIRTVFWVVNKDAKAFKQKQERFVLSGAKAARLGLSEKGGAVPPHDDSATTPRSVRAVQSHPVYAAMVESMDAAAGRILQKLDELGLAGDTLVIFTSDNGGLSTPQGAPTSNLPMRGGKSWVYEGGIRVPLFVRLPGAVLRPGSTNATPVMSTDIFATALDYAGVKLPAGVTVDGRRRRATARWRKSAAPGPCICAATSTSPSSPDRASPSGATAPAASPAPPS